MSGWWIVRDQGLVTVDDCPIEGVDCSSIPANIYMVRMWEGKDGGVRGEILYNHEARAPVREKFFDVTPYIPILNQWMVLAASGPPDPSPPLTVAQARAVKTDMVNYLFNMKRQAPITSGGQSYDASDESVSNMQSQAIGELAAAGSNVGSSVVQLQNSMNASIADFNSKIASFNAYIVSFNNQVGTYNSQNSAFATAVSDNTSYMNVTYVAAINNAVQSSSVATTTTTTSSTSVSGNESSGYTAVTGSTSASSSTFAGGTMGNQSMSTPLALGTSPYLQAQLGGMNSVSASGGGPPTTPTQDALQAIKTRRNTLKSTQTTKTNQISALTTVAAVAAYDITAGW